MCASIGARKDSCARSPLGCDRRSVIHLVVAATAKGGESHEATAVTGSAVLSEALIFSPNEVLAVDSFEPADGEMTSRHLLKMLDKRVVHGSACAATFCVTTTPKRDATSVMKRTSSGPPSLTTPRSAMKRAASVTLFASMPRTAKYPLSDASSEPARPPNAKTCTHESAASGSDRSSPSLRAISAMDLSMITVETGSSIGSVAKPKAPPAAPDAVANALCRSCDPA